MPATDPLDDFVVEPFRWEGRGFDVYRQGQGPAVVLIHELPGLTPAVADLGRRIAGAGFTVFLPHLFGTPGRPSGPGAIARGLVQVCVSREFALFAARRSSPVTEPLRALCRHAHAACGGAGVGVVGLCFTGNFALAMMADPVVLAPVLAQPSLPLPLGRERAAAPGVSDAELAVARRRARDEGVTVLGMRFTHDLMCPAVRFRRLRASLGDGFEAIEIDSGPGNPWGHGPLAHAVLTEDLVDREGQPTRAALDRMLALFEARLRA